MKTLNVEVLGIGFPNKGAELMLAAIRQRIDLWSTESRLVLQIRHDFRHRVRFGAYQKIWLDHGRPEIWRLFDLLPAKALDRLGIIRDKDMDIVFDCSGFAYGDQWGPGKAHRRLGRNAKRWRRQGKRIILLPQAFGPFENRRLRSEMSKIIGNVDLIFARDVRSFEYLTDVAPKATNVFLSPDITIGLASPRSESRYEGKVCLIPNQKMIEKGGVSPDSYERFFVSIISSLRDAGLESFLLLHEGKRDLMICERIRSRLGFPLDLACPDDPLSIKSIIGSSRFVVTSRFHGFVSSLSQGVPSIATSWSHKYESFANEFGQAGSIVDSYDERWVEAIRDRAADESYLSREREQLTARAAEKKAEVEAMWSKIESFLGISLETSSNRSGR